MTSELRHCFNCGTAFYSNNGVFGPYKCNVCLQTEAMVKQAELDREQHYELECMRREEQARNDAARQQAINNFWYQQELKKDIAKILRDPYSYGLLYITSTYNISGAVDRLNLKLFVDEAGCVNASWDDSFLDSSDAREKLKSGIAASLCVLPVIDVNTLIENAKLAGSQIAKKELNPRFTLYTGIVVNGRKIPTVIFDSNLVRTVDSNTGVVSITYNHPFTNEKFNKAFAEGVNEAVYDLNTEDNLAIRIKEQKQQQIDLLVQENKNMVGFFLRILMIIFPVITSIVFWNITSGLTTAFCLLVLVPILWVVFIVFADEWVEKNT